MQDEQSPVSCQRTSDMKEGSVLIRKSMSYVDLGNGIVYEQDVLAMGTDSVLLADFVLPARGRVCDLGCGAGAVMLLMALKGGSTALFDGVELRAGAVEKARRNIERAGLSDRMSVYQADLRTLHETFASAAYTVVVSNPPYMPVGGSIPPEEEDACIARTERCCTVNDLCAAAAYLLQYGGRFCVVYPPERLSALMRVMRENGIEPKRLRLFCRRQNTRPSLVLVEGRRGGKEGLEILPSLFGDSEEFQKVSRTF